MSFRYREYGKFPDQASDFSGRYIDGYSVLNCGSTGNSEYTAGDLGLSGVGATGAFESKSGTGQPNRWSIIKIEMANLRAVLGQAPILLSAELVFWSKLSTATTAKFQAYRMLTEPNWTNMTWRYRVGGTTPWTHDIYGPSSGDDHRSTPFWEDDVSFAGGSTWDTALTVGVTDELSFLLRAGLDMKFLLRIEPRTNAKIDYSYFKLNGYYPYFQIRYLNPIEFFASNDDGTIDLENIAIESDDIEDSLSLGALQRGDTGSAVKAWVKNLSTTSFSLIEIWDDFPEWTDPTHSAGSGTGSLDYVVLEESAVSQRYTINFYSTTEYEVQAEAYRDYTTGLHPSIDADSSWRGTTGTDFTAPSGGLTIPAVCWQAAGLTAADEFEVLVLGNTTDTSWPADSNDMVEITFDSSGVADSASWRPIDGRRTQIRAAVTIDAATKKFYTKAIVTSHWTIGEHCWIGDDTNLDQGTIKSVDDAEIGSDTFTGSGLDDLTLSGNYNGVWDDTLRIEIDGTGTPDTFKWSKDGGSTWEATTVSITGSAQLLTDGIYVTFAATTGHTSADRWDAAITPWTIEVEGLTSGTNSYAVDSRVGTTLPIQSLATSAYGKTNADSGVSEAQPQRIYIDDPSSLGFTVGSTVTISNSDATTHNTRVIATGGVTSTYLELTANLSDDFDSGSFVMMAGVGDAAFWLRPVATTTSTEELKQLRLNVRA